MKKKICVMAMSALMLTACSDEIENEINGSQASEGARYMAINIVSNGAATTRTDPEFSDGDADEYGINSALFYFFDKNGDPFYVATNASGERVNYTEPKDLTGTETKNTSDASITLSKSVVVIEPKYEDGDLPTQVVALINYKGLVTPATKKLDDLRKLDVTTTSYTVTTGETGSQTTTPYYLMTNSVYMEPNDATNATSYTTQYAVPINADNLAATASEAANNAVQIYVERVAAKVSTAYSSTGTTYTYTDTGNKEHTYYVFPNAKYTSSTTSTTKINVATSETATNLEDLKIMVTGYSYYNNSSKSTLLKNIDNNSTYYTTLSATATSALAFCPTWNAYENHRSYWADPVTETTTGEGTSAVTETYVEGQTIAYQDITTATGSVMYPRENTRASLNTGIIFAAQLVTTSTGTTTTYSAYPLVKWLSSYYTPAAAKAAIAKYLSTNYAKMGSSDENKAAQAIEASDFEIVGNGEDDYHATIKFNDGVTIYTKGTSTEIKDAEDNQALTAVIESLPKIQYWKDGKCYFFATIYQLPDKFYKSTTENSVTTTTYIPGVVRNHWYQMTVNSISGLGTPVADPEQAVTPQKPTEDEWYLSTSINVLAWKRSYQGVDLTTD
jgi:hypothetical protein